MKERKRRGNRGGRIPEEEMNMDRTRRRSFNNNRGSKDAKIKENPLNKIPKEKIGRKNRRGIKGKEMSLR